MKRTLFLMTVLLSALAMNKFEIKKTRDEIDIRDLMDRIAEASNKAKKLPDEVIFKRNGTIGKPADFI